MDGSRATRVGHMHLTLPCGLPSVRPSSLSATRGRHVVWHHVFFSPLGPIAALSIILSYQKTNGLSETTNVKLAPVKAMKGKGVVSRGRGRWSRRDEMLRW